MLRLHPGACPTQGEGEEKEREKDPIFLPSSSKKEYTFDLVSFLEMKGVCVGMSKGMHPGWYWRVLCPGLCPHSVSEFQMWNGSELFLGLWSQCNISPLLH